MQTRRWNSCAIAIPRLATVRLLPSRGAALVTSSTLTGLPASPWRMRVRSARYCSATVLVGDDAATRRGSSCASVTTRIGGVTSCTGSSTGASDGGAGGGAVPSEVSALGASTTTRMRWTAPSRSALSRMC